MTRIRQTGPPLIIMALIGGIAGYLLRGSDSQPESRASAAQSKSTAQVKTGGTQATTVSPVKPLASRDVYYPGSEGLAADEMRVVACGTGMPNARPKQAAACFLVELGNGDKFIFDAGLGCAERISAMQIPYDYLDKVFLGGCSPRGSGLIELKSARLLLVENGVRIPMSRFG